MKGPLFWLFAVPALALVAQCSAPPMPGQTTADPALQSDVSGMLLKVDAARSRDCQQRKIADTQNVELTPDHHTERWVVDRCGTPVNYLVTYTKSPRGGTDYKIQPEGSNR